VGGIDLTARVPETAPLDDEFPRWLAACDEQLAAGALTVSPDALGVPDALRERLKDELAWCQMVRQMWSQTAAIPLDRAAVTSRDELEIADSAPERIGRFLLRHELGRGAFGVVSLAYDPMLRREVALKMPRADVMVTPELGARFRNEALAAAGLDHPNIVPVYEAGTAGSVCYIASAYCPGMTLAAWLRQRNTPVPARMAAGLAATLAEAVEHAHRRGVLHRDLKPSNVLLEAIAPAEPAGAGADPIPRITDFGLAKLLDPGPSDEASNPTLSGVILGTPDYMAPEQADGKTRDVGPAADIYSLGAILYEMLTGRPPFQGDSALETLVMVRNKDPLPPSRLRPRLPRDLETICLKCLMKSPQSRYPSAQALADDLRRHLAAQPIIARPVPAWERAVKWVRRHPAQAAAMSAATTTALVVAVVIAMTNVRLERERDLAESRRREAVANLRKAREAVDRMLTRVSVKRLKDIPQVEPVQRALLEDALEFYRDIARQAPDDPEIQLDVSQAYRRLARTYGSLRREDEGERLAREAIAIQTGLTSAYPAVADYRKCLAESYIDLGLIQYTQDRLVESANATQNAIAVLEAMIAALPGGPRYRIARATAHNIRGMAFDSGNQLRAAEQEYRQTIALLEEQAALFPAVIEYQTKSATARNNLGVTLENQGRLKEAEALFLPNLTLWEKLAAADPSVYDYASKQALALDNLAGIWEKTGRKPDAEQALRRSIDLRSGLAKSLPNTPHHVSQLGDELGRLAKLVSGRGDLPEARRLQDQVIVHRRTLVALAPSSADSLEREHDAYSDLIETLILLRAHDEAATAINDLVAHAKTSGPDRVRAGSLLARCAPLAANDTRLSDSQRAQQARAYADRAIELLREAIKRGHRDLGALKTDPGFDALRSRADFRELLASSQPG
jgi:tetratricopeptide (TPR) repeat protein